MATYSPDGKWEWKGGKWVPRSKFAEFNVDIDADFGEDEGISDSVDEITATADPEIEMYLGIESGMINEMHVVGLDRMFSQLSFLGSVASMEVIAQTKKAMDEMMADSKMNYVPVDTGGLQESGEVHVTPKPHRVVASYGGIGNINTKEVAVSDYALLVHEAVNMAHPKGGQAKYLEAPMLKHMPAIDAAAQSSAKITLQKIESVETEKGFAEDVRSTTFMKGGFGGSFRRMTRRNGKLVRSPLPGKKKT